MTAAPSNLPPLGGTRVLGETLATEDTGLDDYHRRASLLQKKLIPLLLLLFQETNASR